jgi:hypothetical protein
MGNTELAGTSSGRPPGRVQGRPFQMRVSEDFLHLVDKWRRKQKDQPSRATAIRRLVEKSLTNAPEERAPSKATARKAFELAAREIDQLGDKSATGEKRASRKRRVIAGPREFRDIRRDRSKPKR